MDCGYASGLRVHCSPPYENGFGNIFTFSVGTVYPDSTGSMNCSHVSGQYLSVSGLPWDGSSSGHTKVMNAVEKLCDAIIAFPFKRPTSRVVAIIELSPRSNAVVVF
ncbi:hypothetical protein Ancab_038270 [Ancistrocladus abbreviatus]